MLIGHQRIWNFLTQSAAKNRLAHAYLFVGSPEIGKKTLALEFVKWLLCKNKNGSSACGQCRSCSDIEKNQHPDVFILQPRQEEKREIIKTFEIGIDEVKSLQHRLSLFPYSSIYKVAIIDGAEWLTTEAANSFLKTLEEPSGKSLIILISSNSQSLLPTIVSRCQLIKFLPVPEKEIFEKLKRETKSEKELSQAVKLSAGRPGRAIKILQEKEFLNNQKINIDNFKKILKSDLVFRWEIAKQLSQDTGIAQETLSQWMLWLRDRIFEGCGCANLMVGEKEEIKYSKENLSNLIKEIQKSQAILDNPSFNARLALEILMMKI